MNDRNELNLGEKINAVLVDAGVIRGPLRGMFGKGLRSGLADKIERLVLAESDLAFQKLKCITKRLEEIINESEEVAETGTSNIAQHRHDARRQMAKELKLELQS